MIPGHKRIGHFQTVRLLRKTTLLNQLIPVNMCKIINVHSLFMVKTQKSSFLLVKVYTKFVRNQNFEFKLNN